MDFFTSITCNYLPKARVLAKSVKRFNPDACFHLVLSDDLPDDFDLEKEPFDNILFIKDLGLPVDNLDMWIYQHTVIELCTAVKPQAFLKILQNEATNKVIYLDPDIVVLQELDELFQLMDMHSIIITPHQLKPEREEYAIEGNEILFMQKGIYNLGFLAIQRSDDSLEFLTWWRDRLLKYCRDDVGNGLFTDQKWVDFAPCFFNDVYILKDKTYNVATWNLTNRNVIEIDNKLCIDGSPVKFYHLSGIDSSALKWALDLYGKGNKHIYKLLNWYIAEQEKEGQSLLGKKPCVYQFYSNGEQITKQERYVFRIRKDIIEYFKNTNPFIVTKEYFCYYDWYRIEGYKYFDENDKRIIELNEQIRILLNSTSWKVTAPLRKVMNTIRRFIGKVSY